MAGSERTKMAAGEWYTCLDAELEALRATAADAVFEHNSLPPRQRGNLGPRLKVLLGGVGKGARIEAPFHCAYGFNIFLGDGAFLNAGCTILDTATIRIGKRTLLGPNVQIYCAEHHRQAAGRQAGAVGSDADVPRSRVGRRNRLPEMGGVRSRGGAHTRPAASEPAMW